MAGRDTRSPAGPTPRANRPAPDTGRAPRAAHPSGRTRVERAQRNLTVMAITVFAFTAIAIAVLLIGRVMNVPQSAYKSGVLQFLAVFPIAGIAVFLLLVIAALVVNVIHRTQASANDR